MGKSLTKEEIVKRAKEVHGEKYDYSEFLKDEFEYKNNSQKIPIICHKKDKYGNEHGLFKQEIKHHIKGCGCSVCAKRKCSFNTTNFIDNGRLIHGNKYDYSLIEKDKPIESTNILYPIICHEKDEYGNEHGIFFQSYINHINKKHGCKICGGTKLKTTDEFVKQGTIKFNGFYKYNNSIYVNSKTDLLVTCPIHGDFKVNPSEHIGGRGCPQCKFDKLRKSKEEFIRESEEIFGKGSIIYDEVEYINNQTDVILICPKHGRFKKTPNLHLSQHQGCPICSYLKRKMQPSRLEKEIESFLKSQNIDFLPQYRQKWLGKMSLDFYLPQYNIAIECQGIQHFFKSGGENSYFTDKKIQLIKKRDKKKKILCEQNGIKLLYYSNLGIDYPYKVFEDKNELLNNILNMQNE